MNKARAALISLLLCVIAAPPLFAESAPSDEDQIRAHYAGIEKALYERDSTAAMMNYAEDVVIFDLGPPLSALGRAASVRTYDAIFSSLTGPLICKFFDTRITIDGKHAYVMTFVYNAFTTKADGKKTELRTRLTNVFEKNNGRWMVIHEHNSMPTDLSTGKAVYDAPAVGEGEPFGEPEK